MKKLLLIMLGVLIALPAMARDFTYEYEGQTLTYTVINEEAKTCKTKDGVYVTYIPGNRVSGKLTIPAIAKDGDSEYTVTSIGYMAFCGCSLTEVIIPNSVTSIDTYAFRGCPLTEVTIGNSVTSIGNSAFAYCTSLEKVIIPNSVTSIIREAFTGCKGLTEVIIGNSVTSIGYEAFHACSGLVKVAYPSTMGNPFGYGEPIKYPAEGAIIEDGVIYGPEKSAIYYASIKLEGQFEIPNSVTFIGEQAFYRCSGLTELTIPNSVTSIGTKAFKYCSGLTEISIPNSLTSIEQYTFEDCSGLTSVNIPNSVTYIGDYAFSGCSGLTEISIPNSVKTIGENVFNSCRSLKSVALPDAITAIRNSTFFDCPELVELTIPNSVTTIGDLAFEGCSGLKSIVIPSAVKTVGSNAFTSCSGLVKSAYPSTLGNPFRYGKSIKYPAEESIIEEGWVYSTDKSTIYFAPITLEGEYTLPESVKTIGEYAFSGCNGLTVIKAMPTIPAEMVKAAFDNATYKSALLTIPDGTLNDYYASTWVNFKNIRVDGASDNVTAYTDGVFKYIFSPGSKEAILVPGDYSSLSNASIPNRIAVENGEDATFYQVTEIGDNAFSGYTKISSIKLPKNLTKIGNVAFKGCTGFTEIELPTSLTTIGASAFENTRFASITLPAGLKIIGNSAFQNSELVSIAFPEALESIGTAAFMNCASLTKVDLTNSSASIDSEAFMDCKALASIDFTKSSSAIGSNAFKGCTALKNLVISDNITEIGNSAFMGCSSLEKVVTGNGTETIPSETFRKCTKLTDVTLGSKVKIIGPYAFEGCTALKNITLPSSVYAIDTYAFSGSGLNKIVIPEGVTKIAPSAFYNCASLTSAEIGNGVAGLGDYAFANCNALTDVKLGNSLERIGNFAFDNCKAIASMTIPASVTTIGENAFSYCTKLESISIPASVATIGKLAFMNCSAMKSFTLADGTSSIKLGESILNGTSIEKAHIGRDFNSTEFQGNSMKELTIGNTVTAVCDNAFKGCSNLTSLKLGATLESIGASAFQNCPLTDIVIPPSVESIGASAFDSNAIKSLAIGYGIKNIGENAFNGSNSIENIYITAVNPPSASNNTFSYYEAPLWLINQTAFDNYIDYPRCWYRFEDNMHPLKQINKISADKLSVSGKPGEVIKLDVTIMPADATLPNIFRKSTRPDLVSVDNEGNVTFLEEQGNIETYSTEECKIIAMTMYEDVPLLEVSVNVESSSIEDVFVDDSTGNDIDYNAPYQVYNLNGILMGESLGGLATGFYIVRQGNNIRKTVVK